MARIASRKLVLAALATLAIGTGVAAPAAEAHPYWGGFHHHHGFGGLGLGLGLGVLGAAAYAASETNCYVERREFVDQYNRIYVRPIRVCD